MQLRAPELFELYIGRYLSADDYNNLQREDLSMTERVLRKYDLERGVASEIEKKAQEEEGERDGISEDEDSESEDDDLQQQEEQLVEYDTDEEDEEDEEEKKAKQEKEQERKERNERKRVKAAGLKEEFVRLMEEKWLAGEDLEYDYEVVDADEQLDDMLQLERDMQDRYFDDKEVESDEDDYRDDEPIVRMTDEDFES